MAKKAEKIRIYDIAKKYNISSDALLKVLRGLGFTVKSHMSVASEDMLEAIEDKFKREIEEVKKDDEARKQKLQELEAQKRREEAKKAALRRKAEAMAKKKKLAAEMKARELAKKKMEEEKAAPAGTVTAEQQPVKAPETKEPARRPAAGNVGPQSAPPRAAGPRTEKQTARTAPPPPPQAKTEAVKKAEVKADKAKRQEPQQPNMARQAAKIEKKLQASTATGKGPKRKKKRGKKKKEEPVVDKQAVKLSFKATMAQMDGAKKHKRHKRRSQEDGEIDEGAPTIEVSEFMTISELAKQLDKKPAELVAKCFELGVMATINQRLDMDTIETLALEFGYNVKPREEVGIEVIESEDEKNLVPRAPVVTIMGHVDHGKTTLLDFLRESDIVAGESGKITQHIGAYEIQWSDGKITVLDTPGHEAFSAMRARGAQVTDIVVLVVSAVEAVMPQTVEAINHAQAAEVPIIVAINKMDLPNAHPDAIRQQLTKYKLVDEEWGGKTIMVEISAKTGTGIDKLLEMVLLQAEILELKSDPDIRAHGTIVESRLEKGRGSVATILVQKGTLHISDPFVAGSYHGRVRAMLDDRGNDVKSAGPSVPVQVTGLSGVPLAGDSFMVTADETEARTISIRRQQIRREYDIRRSAPTTLESVYERIKDGQVSDLKIIIKGDVAGSVEALSDMLSSIGNEEVRVNIIHTGVGAVVESDVDLAVASDAIIVGFHVTTDPRARARAIKEKIDIRTYSVIYEVKEDITHAVEGLLRPEMVERWIGNVEVRQPFRVPKIGVISGSYVQQGVVKAGSKVRVSRNGIVIHDGTISSLKRFKDDVKEVAAGYECGIGIENFDDIKEGDQFEVYELVATERKLV